ncbi:bacteriocin immunity protein [Furfurilactobacillus milii]|uniref:Bacteriocin immunity protein n=1 Tax=Furfurilactobacillus milii TaxID=2888272 RepID=A0A6N9I2M0_9LACO|nr:bacteriocin immunity protein [Furfurilactobacillus milii]MYV17200.1 bacteriocin immunity protein [Furfurilactobacillus milii]
MSVNEQEAILNLFSEFRKSVATANEQENNRQHLLEIIDQSIEKLSHQQQTPQNEARSVYQNINTMCLADHLKLTANEGSALKKISDAAQPKSAWQGLNSFNTANTWPSN